METKCSLSLSCQIELRLLSLMINIPYYLCPLSSTRMFPQDPTTDPSYLWLYHSVEKCRAWCIFYIYLYMFCGWKKSFEKYLIWLQVLLVFRAIENCELHENCFSVKKITSSLQWATYLLQTLTNVPFLLNMELTPSEQKDTFRFSVVKPSPK